MQAPQNRLEIFCQRALSEEGVRKFAYNDRTSKQVTCKTSDPNTTGNLSIGIGVNLEVGLDDSEIAWLLNHRAGLVDTQLKQYAWYRGLDEPRGSVFLDVGFNSGVNGLLHFTSTIHYASLKDWANCAVALMDSEAARKLPSRYERLRDILLSGTP